MLRNKKVVWILVISSLFVGLALVAGAVVTTSIASAKAARSWLADGPSAGWRAGRMGSVIDAVQDGMMHRGGPGGPGGLFGGEQDTYLAEALGITVDELQAAREAAHDAALDEAVAQGMLTQEQADAIRTLRGLGDGQGRMFGGFRGLRFDVDMDALLASELGISVDELNAARQEATQAALADAVANGDITQDQADLMLARQALRSYIDPQELTAQVLGISVDELQAAREAGTTHDQLLENAGLTLAEFQTQMQEAYQAAVAQAVADGVITQEQADLILNAGFGRGFGFGGRGGHGEMWGRGGGFGPNQVTPAPSSGGTNG